MPRIPFAVLAPLFLAACAATGPADVLASRSPADQNAGIGNAVYRNIIGDYTHRRPTGPKSWRSLNDAEAPGGRP